jgi:hypothetical protein
MIPLCRIRQSKTPSQLTAQTGARLFVKKGLDTTRPNMEGVIAKIEWHPGELFPRVGFIVTNLPMEPDWVVRFYNQRGTAEQHIKEGKYAFRWTRLSCRKFRDNEVRLQLHALAYNLATFLRCIELPEAMADWSLTSLQLKLIKIGARVVRHARAITFQLAEVAVTGPMVRAILAAIRRLRAPPLCA